MAAGGQDAVDVQARPAAVGVVHGGEQRPRARGVAGRLVDGVGPVVLPAAVVGLGEGEAPVAVRGIGVEGEGAVLRSVLAGDQAALGTGLGPGGEGEALTGVDDLARGGDGRLGTGEGGVRGVPAADLLGREGDAGRGGRVVADCAGRGRAGLTGQFPLGVGRVEVAQGHGVLVDAGDRRVRGGGAGAGAVEGDELLVGVDGPQVGDAVAADVAVGTHAGIDLGVDPARDRPGGRIGEAGQVGGLRGPLDGERVQAAVGLGARPKGREGGALRTAGGDQVVAGPAGVVGGEEDGRGGELIGGTR